MKSPKLTPPLNVVVQKVIGPPAVPNSLGLVALAPSFEVIRPADLTKIPPLPAVMLAFKEVVAVPSASMETWLPAVAVEPTVMFPPEERDTFVLAVNVAEVVIAPEDEVMEIAPAEELIAAVELVIAPEPEIVMLPVALIAPVGATEVPPLIDTVPLVAVSEPAPL